MKSTMKNQFTPFSRSAAGFRHRVSGSRERKTRLGFTPGGFLNRRTYRVCLVYLVYLVYSVCPVYPVYPVCSVVSYPGPWTLTPEPCKFFTL